MIKMTMLDTAKEAAKAAGDIILSYLDKDVKFEKKPDDSFVSKVDKEAEQRIISIIRRDFPDHCIKGEETGTSGSNTITWHVDPLDGTTNFRSGFKMFCTSIGIEKDNEFIIGVIYNPITDELFYAENGKGAFCNDKPIRVSDKSLNTSLMVFDSTMKKQLIKKKMATFEALKSVIRRFRIIGTVALELAGVASGVFSSAFCINFFSHDIAAGVVLIREAGGIVTDEQGNPPTPDTKLLLSANNKENHEKILKIVKGVYLSE